MSKQIFSFIFLFLLSFGFFVPETYAQTRRAILTPTPVATETATPSATATPIVEPERERSDLTQKSESSVEPLKKILENQQITSVWPFNPIKFAIRNAVDSGVPPTTIVLLLLLPVVASFIAAARNIIGVRGFGIFLPAALAVAFVATGPLVGIGLFLVIVGISTAVRILLRKLKLRIQYLPRMALILWAVVAGVLGILFLAPYIGSISLANVSIFAVLILALLAEDFTRVQLGKSARVAVALTTETLVLSLISFVFLTSPRLQEFALMNPEVLLFGVLAFDFLLGQYVGLRVLEYWRFRRLIKG
jgi:hypothetical protein